MPYIHIRTNVPVTLVQEKRLKTLLGQAVTTLPGKTEQWLMAEFTPDTHLWFAGSSEPAAFVEVAAFGDIAAAPANALTKKLCEMLQAELGMEANRIYVKYEGTHNWGWNGRNF